jgi:hypothetical protein
VKGKLSGNTENAGALFVTACLAAVCVMIRVIPEVTPLTTGFEIAVITVLRDVIEVRGCEDNL